MNYFRYDCAEAGVEPGDPRGLPGRRHGGAGQEEGQPQLLRLAASIYLYIHVSYKYICFHTPINK